MSDHRNDVRLLRFAVVGTSGCGKSTFAKRLSAILGLPHIELDSLFWGPNWTPVPPQEFREKVVAATAGPAWVCDGNYRPVRDIVWDRATSVVWLNYPLRVVFGRTLRRTLRRWWSKEQLFAGNRESLRMSFFSRDSILLWVLQTHTNRQREYRQLFTDPLYAHLRRIEFQRSSQAKDWLATIAASNGPD
jgi:adenylate kinase family enzyme